MIRRIVLLASALLLVATSLAAQARPDGLNLPRDADPNDWEAYFDYGVRMMNAGLAENAQKSFYWSARLNPARAEPLYAMRVAIFMEDINRWQRYMRDDAGTLKLPRMATADSLLDEAMLRSPFLPRSLDLLLYNQLPGRWRQDLNTRGWLAFADRDMDAAIRYFTRAVERHPNSYWRRMDLAQALVVGGRMDEAAEQVRAVLAGLRVRDARELVRVYESKERLEYALGLLYLSRSRHQEAREALERALLENAAAFTAHRGLGLLATARRDPAGAAEEYARAVEIAGAHPLLDYEYGAALVDSRRHAEAVTYLARAVEREPVWAAARLELGRAYDGARRPEEALAAYARYLELAPRSDAATAAAVRRRMELLRAAPAAPPPG
jgi:tetratricopeptide (TPR) repeat protein